MALSFTNYINDVFLSFSRAPREDSLYDFVENLYKSFRRKGTITFFDEQIHRIGDEMSLSVVKAIEEFRIFVVVLSKRYAYSTACLDELVKILKCMVKNYRLVLPIFYKVDPLDVREQKNSYATAMAAHESRFGKDSEKVLNWRSALTQVSNLGCGFTIGHEYEDALIENIVENISTKLSRKVLHAGENIVGLDSCVEKVISLLDIWSHSSVSTFGIWGMGGVGKTTLAKALYNLIADQFEYAIFLSDLEEKSRYKSLESLQEELLSQLFEVKHVKPITVEEGAFEIKNGLHNRRVLLILDDVWTMKTLEMLAGDCNWFGSGSRIIVTTRNKHLLIAYGIRIIYEMKPLKFEDAFELFCWKAFKSSCPPPEFIKLSGKLVNYTGGLPFALEMMGSNLKGKELVEWKRTMRKCNQVPMRDIYLLLKLSFNDLEDNQKGIFLDIACFFNKDYCLKDVQNTLDASYGDSEYHIGVLVEKSLITIDSSGYFGMHNMIKDMGREVVRLEAIGRPGERSRLWDSEEVVEVLEKDLGTENIEGIILESPLQNIQWSGTALKKMTNLKILIVQNENASFFLVGPEYLPNSLLYLEWKQYPSTSLPSSFHPRNLVFLRITYSSIELQKPFEVLKCLDVMDFSYCQSIVELPDMSGVPQLRELKLSHCENLIKVHDSVGFLAKLVDLNLHFCTNLTTLPNGIRMTSLEKLMISYCRSLERFPDIIGNMDCLSSIDARGTGVKELPNSFVKLTSLANLNLMASKLVSLPKCFRQLSNLKFLIVSNCKKLREISEVPSNLKKIYAENCTSLSLQSAGVLWYQAREEVSPMDIIMPGAQISDWFDHRCEGEVLSFWARRKFPAAAFASVHNVYTDWENKSPPIAKLHLFINGIELLHDAKFFPAWYKECHAYMQDLRTTVCGGDCNVFERYLEREWNYVELKVTKESEKSLDFATNQCGLYVYRQETNMEDIRFQCPIPMSVGMLPGNVPNQEATFHLGSDEPGDNSRTKTRDESIQRQLTELVGIDKRCEHIELLLEKFQVVGISGINGIGKTTIAEFVFFKLKLSTQFERCFFFENVREESMKHGVNYLHDKLLYELFKGEKVLIVLDDVGDSNQLEYLSKERDNLGAGSRVIITTKDKKLLASVNVDKIYEVEELNLQESLQLFSLHAFKQNSPEMAYEKLSKKVGFYCEGIPLVLKVLGSFLKSKPPGEWESVLAKFEMIPNNDIQDVLRLSYDGLDLDHQEIFLYIACFLKGENEDNVVHILEGCGFSASVGITALVDRAHVTISDDNKVWMHDLLQDMGREIVGERCLVESHRLGHPEDINASLNEKWKTLADEGLPLDVAQIKDLHLTANTFKRMSTLRMLANSNWAQRLPKVYRPGDHSYPSESRPSKLHPENQDLSKVTGEVESSDDDLEDDEREATIEEDIFDFGSSFVTIKVTDESKLKELPQNLHSLRIEGCHLLESLPDELMNQTSSVSKLYAIDCPSLKNLVGGGNITSLRTLYTLNCRKLEFPLPSENFARLEHLCMSSSCDSLKDFILDHFPKLKTLCILNCPNLESVSISEKFKHQNLESLEIRDCPSLVSFPTKGLRTPKFVSFTLSNCVALRSLPKRMTSLKSLRTLFIDRCPELDSLPERGLPSSLSLLSISFCDKLIPKKEWKLNGLQSLTRLEIESAGVGMKSFPEKDLLPINLKSLRISNLSSLTDLDYHGLQQLTALQSLDINCCHKLSSFPDKGLPSSLVSLSVQDSPLLTRNLKRKFGANWRKIAHVPNIRIDGDFISSNKEEVSFIQGNGII